MQVSKNKVVSLEYHLTDDDGEVIDSSQGGEPLLYLHGFGNLIEGLERELDGKSTGDRFQVSVPPELAYGPRSPELIHTVERSDFEDAGELEIGMQYQLPEEDGGLMFSICEINGEEVMIDANHELAGMNLNFDITVGEIRDATATELEHQHAHYPDEDESSCNAGETP